MSFPIINFKFANAEVSEPTLDLIQNKLLSLEKYIGEETDLKCDVEFEKVAQHQHGPVYRVEVNLWCKGTLYRAEATEDNYEKAIDQVRDELDKEMRRNHKKHDSMIRKGGRRIKEMLRFGR